MEGPGQYLGYRAMQRKIWEQHKVAVPRNLVYDVMGMVDPEGLERRGNGHEANAQDMHFMASFWLFEQLDHILQN